MENKFETEVLNNWLTELIASETELEKNQIELTKPIASYGFDSLSNLTLICAIEEYAHIEIDPTIFEELNSFKEVREWIQEQKN